MTNQRPIQETAADHVGHGFSATQFRQAMGPGYQSALFREQPITTGGPLPVRTQAAPAIRRATKPTQPKRPRRKVRLRLPRLAIGFGRLVRLRLV